MEEARRWQTYKGKEGEKGMECGNYILIGYKNVCCTPIQAGAVLDTGI